MIGTPNSIPCLSHIYETPTMAHHEEHAKFVLQSSQGRAAPCAGRSPGFMLLASLLLLRLPHGSCGTALIRKYRPGLSNRGNAATFTNQWADAGPMVAYGGASPVIVEYRHQLPGLMLLHTGSQVRRPGRAPRWNCR